MPGMEPALPASVPFRLAALRSAHGQQPKRRGWLCHLAVGAYLAAPCPALAADYYQRVLNGIL